MFVVTTVYGCVSDAEMLGVGSLLCKYVSMLSTHVRNILTVATNLVTQTPQCFGSVSELVASDLSGETRWICFQLDEYTMKF